MSTKRRSDKELNHENWNDEDEPEEQGEFVKANEEELKKRKILQPKRKLEAGSTAPTNPFGAISLTAPAVATASTNIEAKSTENGPKEAILKDVKESKDNDNKINQKDKSSDDEIEGKNGEKSDSDSGDTDEDEDSSSDSDDEGGVQLGGNVVAVDSDEEEDIDSDDDEDIDEEDEGSDSEENASDGDE